MNRKMLLHAAAMAVGTILAAEGKPVPSRREQERERRALIVDEVEPRQGRPQGQREKARRLRQMPRRQDKAHGKPLGKGDETPRDGTGLAGA